MPRPSARTLPALLLLASACLASPLVHPRAAEELRRGYAHLQAGDPERAEVAFEHALEFAPDLPEGWNGLGVVARGRDDAATARRRFAHAVRLAPGFAEGHANLGEALLTLERLSEAIEELRAALRIDPDLVAARQNLARALLRQGLADGAERQARWREARREYLHLLEASPDSAPAQTDLAFMDYLCGPLRASRARLPARRRAGADHRPAARALPLAGPARPVRRGGSGLRPVPAPRPGRRALPRQPARSPGVLRLARAALPGTRSQHGGWSSPDPLGLAGHRRHILQPRPSRAAAARRGLQRPGGAAPHGGRSGRDPSGPGGAVTRPPGRRWPVTGRRTRDGRPRERDRPWRNEGAPGAT